MTGKRLTRARSRLANDLLQVTSSEDNQLRQQFKLGDIAWIKIHDHSWWPAQVVGEEGVSTMDGKKKAKDEALVRLYGTYDYLYVDPLKCSSEFENNIKQENNSIREAFEKALKEDISKMTSSGKSKRKASEYKENSEAEAGKKQRQDKKERNQEPGHRPLTRGLACGSKKVKAEEEHKDNARDEASVDNKASADKKGKQEQVSKPKLTVKHGTSKDQRDVNRDEVRKEVTEKANDGSKSRTRKQDGSRHSKQKDTEDPKMEIPTSSNSATQEAVSARRMRVMRRLGLVAPEGSPFRRNGFVMTALQNT